MPGSKQRLRERYRIERLLGRGGQCQVYCAADEANDGTTVVVKKMIHHSDDRKVRLEELQLFLQEATILGQVSHPNLPCLVDSFQEGDAQYVVEQCVGNMDLDALLHIRKRLTEEEVAWLAYEMLDLLSVVHQNEPRIVLRDIKPSNITCIADPQGRIEAGSRFWFIDLTIATHYHAGEPDAVKMGSPGYAPPEQYRGHSQPRSDLYALGVTLLQMLTGHDPARTPFNMPKVRTLRADLSAGWERVLERSIALDLPNRYHSAEEMREDLEYVLPRSQAVPPKDVTALPRAPLSSGMGGRSQVMSRARVAMALAAAMLVLMGLLSLFGGFARG